MGLLDLITDGASASFRNKANEILFNYDSEDTLEHAAREEMLGSLEDRTLGAGKDYLLDLASDFESRIKDEAVDLVINKSFDFLKNTKGYNKVTDFEKSATDFIDDITLESVIGTAFEKTGFDNPFGDSTQADIKSVNLYKQSASARKEIASKQDWTYQSDQSEGYPSATEFLQMLSVGDNRFKVLQNYLFYITIDFDQVASPGFDSNHLFLPLEEEIEKFDDSSIKLLVRSVDVPNITADANEAILNEFGYATFPSDKIIPDTNEVIIGFLNTEYSIHENLFVEWIKETTADRYIYADRPFRKATINIDFFDQRHKKIVFSYVFKDCFPRTIMTLNGDYGGAVDEVRTVTFLFNRFYVKSTKD